MANQPDSKEIGVPFQISGLDPAPFHHLYGMTDVELAEAGARRRIVDRRPGFPDRIELRDLDLGERAILVNHIHQPAATPYRASHAIFILEGARTAASLVNDVPQVIRLRPISLRAFDAGGDMVVADLVEGCAIKALIELFLADPAVAYLHAHYARQGCYAARIDRI